MILSLVMRPALMLFGLVTAMLLTQPITGLVNASFMSAISGVQADSTTGLTSFFAYVTIYTIMMTTILHTVFSLIHYIPDNVPRWIGVHASGGPASPDQNQKEAGHVFAGGVQRISHGVGSGGVKSNERPSSGDRNTDPRGTGGFNNDEHLPGNKD